MWETQTGGAWGDHELEYYTDRASNSSLDGNGNLQITARKEHYTGPDGHTNDYTSARLMGRRSFQYGYLETRMSIPTGQGLWPAFWTLGANIRTGTAWPACGEIDVMESVNDMSFVAGTLHGPKTNPSNQWDGYSIGHDTRPGAGWTTGYHRYGIYWTPGSITWYFDGQPFATVNRSDLPANSIWAFDKPQVPLLNLAVGGSWPGTPDSNTAWPAVMSVDYVRLYDHP